MRRTAAPIALAALLAAAPAARAQKPGLWYAAEAADSILSTEDGGVSLEAFDGDTVTGVFLRGTWRGEPGSVAWGVDGEGRRYAWFSVSRGDSLDYVAMLIDVDLDVTPDYLLFRTIDHDARREGLVEYRNPTGTGATIDIQVQSACKPPRCDPDTWTVLPRQKVEVGDDFFLAWRPVFALAASRGEEWLGKPKSLFVHDAAAAPPK